MKCFITLLLAAIAFFDAQSQDFIGQYSASTENGMLSLQLESNDALHYTGQLSGNGLSYSIYGRVQNGFLIGTVGDDGVVFQAQMYHGNLNLTLAETDMYGNIIANSQQYLVLQPGSSAQAPGQGQGMIGSISINGKVLNQDQIAGIERTYGVSPKPGNYWYDATSGLYGVMGYAAYGFMRTGHDYGTLPADASQGTTGIFINGRELPAQEWTVWSYIVGTRIERGRYWLDGKGNAGYEGSVVPLVNLAAAAQQNGYTGKGGSGDNFWSTRFSAGNYNSDNTQGYVSVPGYGPVGYGF